MPSFTRTDGPIGKRYDTSKATSILVRMPCRVHVFVFIYVIRLIHLCHPAHSHVFAHSYVFVLHLLGMTHSFICVIRLIHMSSYLQRHDTSKATCILVCVPCRMHTYVETNPFVCHDSSICTQWLMHLHAMIHSFVSFHSFIYLPICVPWLIHTYAVPHLCACHDSFICVISLIHISSYLCHRTHS